MALDSRTPVGMLLLRLRSLAILCRTPDGIHHSGTVHQERVTRQHLRSIDQPTRPSLVTHTKTFLTGVVAEHQECQLRHRSILAVVRRAGFQLSGKATSIVHIMTTRGTSTTCQMRNSPVRLLQTLLRPDDRFLEYLQQKWLLLDPFVERPLQT